jgi:predicted dehydrogenase
MRAKLKVGVVGVGHLGSHHARHYAQHADCELVGVCDRDRGRAEATARELGCRVFPDEVALAAAVDALSIAVPAAAHAAAAIPCLERGVAVLLEKPMARSLREADAILAAAEKSGAPLMIGHVERWNGAFRRVAPRIAQPRFIEGHRLASFGVRGLDVDVIFDLMIHDLDLIGALSSAPVERIMAVGVPVLTQTADIANVRLELADGLVANLTASRVSRERMRKFRIFQPDAYFAIDFAARRAEVIIRRPGSVFPPAGGATAGPEALARLLGGLEHSEIDASDDPEPLAAEIAAFVTHVREGSAPGPGGEDGRKAVALAEEVASAMAATMARAERMSPSKARAERTSPVTR